MGGDPSGILSVISIKSKEEIPFGCSNTFGNNGKLIKADILHVSFKYINN